MATIDRNRLKVISLISIDVAQISGLSFFYVVEYFAWLYPFQKCHGFSICSALSIFEIFFYFNKILINVGRLLHWSLVVPAIHYPASNYMFKVNNRNFRTWCERFSKLTIKTTEWLNWRQGNTDVIDVVLVFLLLTSNIFHIFF